MSSETAFISALRRLATDPAARGLADDAAVLELGGTRLVLTHDMVVEGVHFLADDPPGDVAWKLLAVNLSDLAAKGARPLGALMGYSLRGDAGWDRAFLAGLEEALAAFSLPLLGGDTVSVPATAPRALGLTAIGTSAGRVPSRSGAKAGQTLWVSGTIGDAGAGLRILRDGQPGAEALVRRYRRPSPRLSAGGRLAPLVGAMMDVSDGLLIDAGRMADASGVAILIDLARMPLSSELVEYGGSGRAARLVAATAGDDYELLFSAPFAAAQEIFALAKELGLSLLPIGRVEDGSGLSLRDGEDLVPRPESLGWEHR
ncbi:thiamine-phosphate kinase [Sphingomonas parva]|uniref:Thiamine-monophosphate kinase n=1 Tax=Sphingomonas parva TaxID=2555898 RepID=A0A4Y8ZVH7_9SPHN|nr:thiamine-phosphate kinase [Sphingomonas parva]TFI59924.1 thiamine-phosphate kinase [Sphingomonas parva]